jgi:hypothetical protein
MSTITAEFEITKVHGEPRVFSTKHGPLASYTVSCKSDQGAADSAELVKKPESNPPSVGERFMAELIPKDGFPPRLKRISDGGARPSPAQTVAGGGDRRGAEILRQHSQDMALRVIEFRAAHGVMTDKEKGATTELIQKYADWFDRDAKAAGDRA